jgi:hypothetical protein
MQPSDAFLNDLEIMLRTLVAGAVRAPKPPSIKPRSIKPAAVKKSVRTKPGERK